MSGQDPYSSQFPEPQSAPDQTPAGHPAQQRSLPPLEAEWWGLDEQQPASPPPFVDQVPDEPQPTYDDTLLAPPSAYLGKPEPPAWAAVPQPSPAQSAHPASFESGYPSAGSAAVPTQPGWQSGTATPHADKPKSRRGLLIGLIAAVVVLALLAVAALVLVPRLQQPKYDEMTFHPVGPQTMWLNPAYTSGFSLKAVEGRPVGFDLARQVYVTGDSYLGHFRATNANTGEEVWFKDYMTCGDTPALDGVLYCSIFAPGGLTADLTAIDIATGQSTVYFPAPYQVFEQRPVGVLGATVLIQMPDAEGERLVSFPGDGTIAWETIVPDEATCELLGDHVGCANDSGFTVLDANSGQATVEWTELTEGDLHWLTDGYYTASSKGDEVTARVHGFDGVELAEIINPSVPVPGAEQRVFYPLADIQQDGQVVAVNSDGKVIGSVRDGGVQLHPSEAAIPDARILGLTADASVLLVEAAGAYSLRNGDGGPLHSIASTQPLQILDGMILVPGEGDTYSVLVPNP